MHAIQELLVRKIKEGLTRKSIAKCSDWACKYRVMGSPFPGPWNFKHHPWLRDMHDSLAPMNIGQKAAQMGYTETVLNKTLFHIDINLYDCLYLFPSWKPDATDFSAGRFQQAIENSQHIRDLFSNVSNVGHKRAGSANFYIRGSKSRAQLKSIPVSFIVIDEKDEMVQENIPLVFERQAGQVAFSTWQISTPTYPRYGINADFETSSKNYFFFKCPHCSKHVTLNFPESLVVTGDSVVDPNLKDSHLICVECKHRLEHETKIEWLANGFWIETEQERDIKGWYINQLYSMTRHPVAIAETAVKAESDPSEETEYWNSKGGLPHTVKGSSVTDEDLHNCISEFKKMSKYSGNRIITMGVDVGYPWLHFEIDEWMLPPEGTPVIDINVHSRCRIINEDKCMHFTEIGDLMDSFRVNFCVVDAQPERRQALDFANKYYNRVKLCSYEQGITGKSIHLDAHEPRVKVDRTSWLDLALGRFRSHKNANRNLYLPLDLSYEYKDHIKAQVRIYEKDRNGNPIGRYITPTGLEDHFGHARNYAEIALPLACSAQSPQSIFDRTI